MEEKAINLPFYKEYPERDTEFVRLYPNVHRKLNADEIWVRKEMGFYIHIPFCKNVCISCPYNKLEPRKRDTDRFLEGLKKEITNYASRSYIQDHEMVIGYLGGGTPTSFNDEQIVDLLQHLRKSFNFANNYEFNSETTPIDISKAKAEKMIENGINRFSIGVQSFQDNELVAIGRNYTRTQVIEAIKLFKDIGVNFNIDLMYNLPGQTIESWEENLSLAIDYGINSISFYKYILIESAKTATMQMRNKIPPQPNEATADKMFYRATEKLSSAGYEGFYGDEFCKPGYKNGYAIGPWEKCLDIIGLGTCALGNVKNYWYLNEPKLDKYLEQIELGRLPLAMGSKISKEDELRRRVILGIKTCRMDRSKYVEATGFDLAELFPDVIKQLEEWGLLKLTDEALEVIGPKGWYYLDNISKAFYDEKYKRYPQPINSDISRWIVKEK